jgi:hypothetical protein
VSEGDVSIAGMTSHVPSVRATAANRVVASACHDCGSDVEWIDQHRAATLGFDLDRSVAFFGVRSADELDTWICTMCPNGATLSRVASGRIESGYLQVRAAIDRLRMVPRDRRKV